MILALNHTGYIIQKRNEPNCKKDYLNELLGRQTNRGSFGYCWRILLFRMIVWLFLVNFDNDTMLLFYGVIDDK